MKKLLVLVMVLGMVSFASAVPLMELISNGDGTYGISLPSGMSGAADGTGVYWAIIGIDPDSGILNPYIKSVLPLSAIYGDAGDCGIFKYGLGVWGDFRTYSITYNVEGGIYASGFTILESWPLSTLYFFSINDDGTEVTHINLNMLDPEPIPSWIFVPEPGTIALLCLGALVIRHRK